LRYFIKQGISLGYFYVLTRERLLQYWEQTTVAEEMGLSKDRILIKNLYQLKGYGAETDEGVSGKRMEENYFK